ncbi:g-type lysozyme inhibitor [Lysobacter gummosus]
MPSLFLRFARTAVFALSLGLAAGAVCAADQVTTVPVTFAKGTTGATVKGAIKGYDSMEYLVAARAGQSLRASLSGSSNANLNVYPPRAAGASAEAREALAVETSSDKSGAVYSARLPADGEYRIQVYQPRAAARRGTLSKFSLRIDIR